MSAARVGISRDLDTARTVAPNVMIICYIGVEISAPASLHPGIYWKMDDGKFRFVGRPS